jgi:hypothetical protein
VATIQQMRLDYQRRMREERKKLRKTNKYNARRSKGGDGRGRASELEHSVAGIIRQRVAAGELLALKEQDKLEFFLFGVRILAYIPDFKVQDARSGEIFWIEGKGFEGEKWSVIKGLWRAAGPGRLEIWQGHYSAPKLTETIRPKANVLDANSGWRV